MTPEQKEQLQTHVSEIAKLLHADAVAQGLKMESLAEIEKTFRSQVLTHVSPEIGIFLSTHAPSQIMDIREP